MKYLFISLLFIFFSCSSPEKDEYTLKLESFIEASQHIYNDQADELLEYSDISAFTDSIIGTSMGNYQFQDYYGNDVDLLTDSKPVLLESFASWCAPCISSIPALNQLSEDYPEVRFIILAHDTPDKLEKYADQLNSRIHFIPSDSIVNASKVIKLKVGGVQSIFPFPTTFSIDAKGVIQNVMIGGPRAGTFGGRTYTEEEVYETNLERLGRELDHLISK
ncbi:TlpA disulfide reductase family protein [Marivirga salinae]|uniref:TlpA disulfide reductase family protein n=1 Tax=Marivirga salinarum TaxID=3059078 RepID=A0AA49GBR2_9BACT|nr:TlpA disulfide reductase family protein [Marivirga sp. BDSF4-3]WKK75100.1 TlpA disulfide reductase family protein [Marivirga sp. BDSF4-3]